MIENLFKGYNGTIMAYGQTNSGKTHTLMGEEKENEGMLPRIMKSIF